MNVRLLNARDDLERNAIETTVIENVYSDRCIGSLIDRDWVMSVRPIAGGLDTLEESFGAWVASIDMAQTPP